MTAAKTTPPPPAPPETDLQTLASILGAAEAVHSDGFKEPGDIAADDVGATRLATELNRSLDPEREPQTTP